MKRERNFLARNETRDKPGWLAFSDDGAGQPRSKDYLDIKANKGLPLIFLSCLNNIFYIYREKKPSTESDLLNEYPRGAYRILAIYLVA